MINQFKRSMCLLRLQRIGYSKGDSKQHGFTLIELMIIVFIIGILAAIAIPSYRRYTIINAEDEAKAKMLQLQIELEQWRSTALTYKGFIPKSVDTDGKTVYRYDNNDKMTVNVPLGSGDDYTYRITLVDGDTATSAKSLVSATAVDNITGRTWKMLATPNPNRYIKRGRTLLFSSSGIRCMTTETVAITSANCGNSSQSW